MKLLATILTVCLLCCPAMAGNFVNADYGVLMSNDGSPAQAISVRASLGVGSILGPVIDAVQPGLILSKRDWEADEVYGLSLFLTKDQTLGKFFGAAGVGGWYFANTDGGDVARTAATADVGYNLGRLQFHLGGDIISFKNGADWYYPHIGASFSF